MRIFLLVVSLTSLATGCSNLRTFQASSEPRGGYDGAGDSDQLYFDVRNMRGFEDGPYGLVLPSDWSQRARRRESERVSELVEPLALGEAWLPAAELEPPAVWMSTGFGHQPSSIISAEIAGIDLLVIEQQEVFDPDPLVEEVTTRLQVGASAYVVVRSEQGPQRRFALYGAVGPPVRWVRLGSIDFTDRRSSADRVLDVALRGTGNVIGVVVLAAIVVGPIVWIFA